MNGKVSKTTFLPAIHAIYIVNGTVPNTAVLCAICAIHNCVENADLLKIDPDAGASFLRLENRQGALTLVDTTSSETRLGHVYKKEPLRAAFFNMCARMRQLLVSCAGTEELFIIFKNVLIRKY